MSAVQKSETNAQDIELACQHYRAMRDNLRVQATAVNDCIEDIKRQYLPMLRTTLSCVADAETVLRDAVNASAPSMWARARTRIIHGVKVGWTKSRGKVTFDDESKVIERIRKLLPKDQVALLVRVRESVHKPGVYDLTAADLRRLGISIADDCDQVVVKDIESELDRALEKLLADITEADA
ncbi:MAG: hypothetical protein CVV18_00360 [Gammaproteobacteria bacterium HGW-Gammaproteobacteria-8]|jgi:hypothetical protein|nr:MAG: hypothetical protein CVV18_00360 [Gammaproteobacteria bacterium HGW-Gammaproteobacteria-8]